MRSARWSGASGRRRADLPERAGSAVRWRRSPRALCRTRDPRPPLYEDCAVPGLLRPAVPTGGVLHGLAAWHGWHLWRIAIFEVMRRTCQPSQWNISHQLSVAALIPHSALSPLRIRKPKLRRGPQPRSDPAFSSRLPWAPSDRSRSGVTAPRNQGARRRGQRRLARHLSAAADSPQGLSVSRRRSRRRAGRPGNDSLMSVAPTRPATRNAVGHPGKYLQRPARSEDGGGFRG